MQIVGYSAVACVALYLLAIMPRMLFKPDWRPFQGWHYAHRGLHDKGEWAPENSLRAFRRAAEKGYGIELDIQLTRDKRVVVFHDYTLKRVCGQAGRVSDYTYEELRRFPLYRTDQKIPLLEEVLRLVDGRVPLIVELKIEGTDLSLCPIAATLLRTYSGIYCLESFNPLGLFWYRWRYPKVVRGQLSDHFPRRLREGGLLMQCLRYLLFNWLTKPDFIAYRSKYPNDISRWLCRHFYGAVAVAWTVKSKEEMKRLEKEFDLFIFEDFRA